VICSRHRDSLISLVRAVRYNDYALIFRLVELSSVLMKFIPSHILHKSDTLNIAFVVRWSSGWPIWIWYWNHKLFCSVYSMIINRPKFHLFELNSFHEINEELFQLNYFGFPSCQQTSLGGTKLMKFMLLEVKLYCRFIFFVNPF